MDTKRNDCRARTGVSMEHWWRPGVFSALSSLCAVVQCKDEALGVAVRNGL